MQRTPYGLGRRADVLPRISAQTDVHLVAATGLHRAEHCPSGVVDRVSDDLADLFVRELTVGIGDGSTRAGLIKVASRFHVLDSHARHVLAAAADAHHATGAPTAIHHELGTAADAVLDRLCDTGGVPPTSVILGHLNRFPIIGGTWNWRSAVRSWGSTGLPGRTTATDSRLLDCLTVLAEAGYSDRLLLGGDTTDARARAATGEGPGIPYLLECLRRDSSATSAGTL